MAVSREPILKRCKSLGISPMVMGVGKETKREPNKEEAKDVKEEEVPRLERRQRKWEDRGIRIGTTNNR